jgi:hypothetical protein
MAARANCRCGQPLEIPPDGVEHVTCPRCAAKVRLVRRRGSGDAGASGIAPGDDYIRFHCPCGRRLKVSAIDRPSHGKCPDCGRIVPVPVGAGTVGSNSDAPTEELAAADQAMLEAWTKSHLARGNGTPNGESPTSTAEMAQDAPGRRAEAGFRVCPRCGKPIHLNADICRGCGTTVPKR